MATAAQAKPTVAKPPRLTRGARARLYAEYLLLTEIGKFAYKAKDGMLDLVLECPKRETRVPLKACHFGKQTFLRVIRGELKRIVAKLEGKTFAVRDKFAERNSIPVGQNARRFEIEEI